MHTAAKHAVHQQIAQHAYKDMHTILLILTVHAVSLNSTIVRLVILPTVLSVCLATIMILAHQQILVNHVHSKCMGACYVTAHPHAYSVQWGTIYRLTIRVSHANKGVLTVRHQLIVHHAV